MVRRYLYLSKRSQYLLNSIFIFVYGPEYSRNLNIENYALSDGETVIISATECIDDKQS